MAQRIIQPSYTRLSAAALRALIGDGKSTDVEVFLPPGDHQNAPVLYRKAGASLCLPDVDRMSSHGVSTYYVRAEDFHFCEQELERRLGEILTDHEIAPRDKAEIVHTIGASVAHDLVSGTVTHEGVARASLVVDRMIGAVLNDPLIADYLLRMAGHERTTASHMFVVSALAVMLGAEVFGTETGILKSLSFAGMLHDLGKLSIPAGILRKQTPLTRDETILVQQHPIESVRLIGVDPNVSAETRQMILEHHERVDGRGYPIGLRGPELMLGSKLLAIVDSFHALVGRRSYRAALTPGEANRVMMTQAGRQFDEELLALWVTTCERNPVPSTPIPNASAEPDDEDLASRHEHRPAPSAPKVIFQRQPRFECKAQTMVQCIYNGRVMDSPAPTYFSALLQDVSRSGLCFYSAHPMYRGEVVHARIVSNAEVFWVRCIVAWCRRYDANQFKIGARFLQRVSENEAREPVAPVALERINLSRLGGSRLENRKPATNHETDGRVANGGRHGALKTLSAIAALRNHDREAQQTVVTLAMSGDHEVRLKALDLLPRIRSRSAREALVVLLSDANIEIRERAIHGVTAAKVMEGIGRLRDLLRDPNPRIALLSARALGKMDDQSGLRLAAQWLESNGTEARLAAQAVGDILGTKFPANKEGIIAARRYLAARESIVAC